MNYTGLRSFFYFLLVVTEEKKKKAKRIISKDWQCLLNYVHFKVYRASAGENYGENWESQLACLYENYREGRNEVHLYIQYTLGGGIGKPYMYRYFHYIEYRKRHTFMNYVA